jgi:GAF domain-containing protein/HAMP domain-containing protein
MKKILFNLSLSKKLLIQTSTFIVSFLLALAIVFTSQHFLTSSGQNMDHLNTFRVNLSELRTSLNALRGEIFVSLMSDPATMKKEIAQSRVRYDEHRANVDVLKRSLDEISVSVGNEALRRSSQELFAGIDVLTSFSDKYIDLAAKADQVNNDSLYQEVLGKVLRAFEPMFIAFRKSIIDSNKITEDLREKAMRDYQDTVVVTNVVLILFFVLTATFVFVFSQFLSRMISRPVIKTKDTLERISRGELPDVENSERKDEVGTMLNSLKTLVGNLENLKSFTQEVGKGNFESQVSVFENRGAIAASLQAMRDSLKTASIKEQQAAWISQGLAETGKILRLERSHAAVLYEHVLSFVVKYLRANQGSLFITVDEEEQEKKLELVACFAYDRKKYLQKTLSFGDGLIGQACLERDVICLTDVPSDYVKITSGLGEASPNNLIIVPLINEDSVHGVIEIASFKKMQEYQLDFLKQFSHVVAAEIAGEKINARTRELLEKSQQQTEELKAQEEEMRQNMEELAATQEQMERQLREA